MYIDNNLGLVKAEYGSIKHGDGFSFIPMKHCYLVMDFVANGSPLENYPYMPISREEFAFILTELGDDNA